ncbi:lytic transglycosylase domain-containing protein [Blastomonas sp.]|uniref:lytic transglycosylase domain-containing protein n=1 Tax=Blastomonas sp. TaxID=1909299 RepID=UPI00359355E5
MNITPIIFAVGVILNLGTPVCAQVIEIDANGESRTFDGPTLFIDDMAVPLNAGAVAVAMPSAGSATTASVATLLANAARTHRLPDGLLEAVAWQESRGRMSAISHKGAVGVMQLMPATAAELGVRADDLEDNIRGGALYLRRQLDRFGSVRLALAAYNAGPGAVQRYGGIPPYRETVGYVSNIMGRWQPPSVPKTLAVPTPAPLNTMLIEVTPF